MKRMFRILIVGAGEAGLALLADLRQKGLGGAAASFIDDDPAKIGREINGLHVAGPVSEIKDVCNALGISDVIIAVPSAGTGFLTKLIKGISSTGRRINIHYVPAAEKFFDSVPIFPSMREFSYSDLLDRDEFSIDLEIMERFFCGKNVLVTGAGGSIGSEICRQLLKFNVKKIIATGRGENSIYNLMRSMDEYLALMSENRPELVYRIIDARDKRLMERLFSAESPDIVFHAAAHKHVPLMEFNGIEALQNNVLGADNLLALSAEYGVKKFVLVSTDKAVRPASIMGATKRICELVTGYYSREKGLNTAIVRFGNVLGSRGSVVPLFIEQIARGGPVTVTHPEVVRYFMSIPEASLLVINSAAISSGGEIFVLNMGEQFRIVDIARRLIELNGYRPDIDIRIEFTGLRPGEKLYEELFYDESSMVSTGNNSIFMMRNDDEILDASEYSRLIAGIRDQVPYMNDSDVRGFLKSFVKSFTC
jgi:FlaA1/EpsC-like NDP-sugar epimerase